MQVHCGTTITANSGRRIVQHELNAHLGDGFLSSLHFRHPTSRAQHVAQKPRRQLQPFRNRPAANNFHRRALSARRSSVAADLPSSAACTRKASPSARSFPLSVRGCALQRRGGGCGGTREDDASSNADGAGSKAKRIEASCASREGPLRDEGCRHFGRCKGGGINATSRASNGA
jgi:hypothetical protein